MNPYSELSAPLRRERLNTLQDFLDRELSGRDCPAALRAAAAAVTEELFSAALSGTSEDNGSFTCRVRRSGSISFSFFHGGRPFLPDLHALPRQPPARGLRLQVRGQECLLLVERPTGAEPNKKDTCSGFMPPKPEPSEAGPVWKGGAAK